MPQKVYTYRIRNFESGESSRVVDESLKNNFNKIYAYDGLSMTMNNIF